MDGVDRFPHVRLPFRLGTTSYIIPAGLLENVRSLADRVDDIELVLYDDPVYGSNIPDMATAQALKASADDHSLTYTVHLPKDIGADPQSLLLAERVITATLPLKPVAYILHFDGRPLLTNPQPAEISRWQCEARQGLAQIVALIGDPALVCVENLERWNPDIFDGLIEDAGVSRCVDIGHLWLDGRDPLPYLHRHLSQTRVIHLHGIGSTDHQSLAHMPRTMLLPVYQVLQERAYAGIVTLEVFSEDDFMASMQVLCSAIADVSAALT